ncbi:hypothetical protein [Salaquimonas pukyongi]|uniref:hypothetical protein n=1 Tax=Salaquimonas pukyongi TaxID=2712698 RepID=UPI0012EC828A|nr:hypothetical protein [Salaquimonas pukyongi]
MTRIATHEKLSHLSQGKIDELLDRYYAGERIASLLEQFDIDVRPSALVGLFPPKVHDDLHCPYCDGQSMISKRSSRSGYSRERPYCPSCNHQNIRDCRCKNCVSQRQQIRAAEEAKRRDVIQRFYGPKKTSDLSRSLTFLDALSLLSLARHSLCENLVTVSPYSENQPKFAPTFEITNDLVRHLYGKGYLWISEESDVEAFTFNEAMDDIEGYYPTRVQWLFLPGCSAHEKREFLHDTEELVRHGDWREDWYGEADTVYHIIGKYECLEYFDYLLRQRDFEIDKFGEKTHSTFEDILKRYSIAQTFNITWMAVRDTVDYLAKEGVPRYQGKNYFIGAVQRKADRATANKWDVKHSRRDFGCPQSVLSATYFNLFLEIGDKGLESPLPKLDA